MGWVSGLGQVLEAGRRAYLCTENVRRKGLTGIVGLEEMGERTVPSTEGRGTTPGTCVFAHKKNSKKKSGMPLRSCLPQSCLGGSQYFSPDFSREVPGTCFFPGSKTNYIIYNGAKHNVFFTNYTQYDG